MLTRSPLSNMLGFDLFGEERLPISEGEAPPCFPHHQHVWVSAVSDRDIPPHQPCLCGEFEWKDTRWDRVHLSDKPPLRGWRVHYVRH